MGASHSGLQEGPGLEGFVKPLLEQVEENMQAVALCPACVFTPGLADSPENQMGQGTNGVHKRGRWKGFPRSSMPRCRFCQGSGVVYLNRICECGMPAVLYTEKQKVWYCGAEMCANAANWRANRTNMSGAAGGHHPHPWESL